MFGANPALTVRSLVTKMMLALAMMSSCKKVTPPPESDIAGVWEGVANCEEWETQLAFYLAESDGVVTGAALFDDGSQRDVSGTWARPKLYLTWPPGSKLDGVLEGDTITGEFSAAGIDHSCDAVLSRQRQTERQ